MDKIPYILRRSRRRTLAIKITPEGVWVYAPYRTDVLQIDRFVESKRSWIENKLEAQAKQPVYPALTDTELNMLYRQARMVPS